MFSKKEIKNLAYESYKEFSKKHKVSCKFSFVTLNEFWKLAKKSKIIQDELRKRIPLKIGALVIHDKKDIICLNEDIINQITSNSNFVKAIVMHELYHIFLKNKVRENSLQEDIKSENRVNSDFSKEFPKYAKYLS